MCSLDNDSHGQEIEEILHKSRKFCHLPVLQPARASWVMQPVESKIRIRDCLADVYISENPE